MSSALRGLAPREVLESCTDEDGPYWATTLATPQAVGRQVWGPPFPERRQHSNAYFLVQQQALEDFSVKQDKANKIAKVIASMVDTQDNIS